MPSKDKHHVLLRLDVETYERLASVAKSRERTVPQEIRLAIRDLLSKADLQLPSTRDATRGQVVQPRFKR